MQLAWLRLSRCISLRTLSVLLTAATALVAFAPPAVHAAPSPLPAFVGDNAAFRYFPETGHLITGNFKAFFDAHGGLDVFGFPRTEAVQENGLTVQYFQRARMEWHPELNAVQLSLLGSLLTAGRQFAQVPPAPDSSVLRYFPEVGHTVHHAFLSFFDSHGGLDVFGYPISEETVEDGFRVQYFQRARMEWHPELPPAYAVSLTLLGDRYIQQYLPASPWLAPVPKPEFVAEGQSNFAGSPPNRVHNVALMAKKLNGVIVPDGAVFSFDDVMGDVGPDAGWAEGIVIVNHQSQAGLGGGICQVSTTTFRAAFWAGLPIVERHDHAYPVPYYTQGGAPEGFDATVWSPTLDLKFKNDTGAPLMIATRVDPANANLYVDLYGKKVDRKVHMIGPFFANWKPHPPDKYVVDPTLAPGDIEQTDWAHDGVDVTLKRQVTTPDGKMQTDVFASHYLPWQAVYQVGPQAAGTGSSPNGSGGTGGPSTSDSSGAGTVAGSSSGDNSAT